MENSMGFRFESTGYTSKSIDKFIKKIFLFLCPILFLLSEKSSIFHFLDALHVKHFVIMLVVFVGVIANINQIKKFKEVRNILLMTGILFLISSFLQLSHGRFEFYSIEEIYYFLIPIFFSSLVLIEFNQKDIDLYFFILTCVLIFCYIDHTFINNPGLSFENLKKMFDLRLLIMESNSPINSESGIATYFMMLLLYYGFKNKKRMMIICFIGVLFCYKRIPTIFALLYMAYYLLFRNKNWKSVNRFIYISTIVIFAILPLCLEFFYSASFAKWFTSITGLEFDTFTMTRYQIVTLVRNNNIMHMGLGSITNFLEVLGLPGQTSLHSDILRIYYECTILGSIILSLIMFKITKRNIYSYILILFLVCQMIFDHPLGVGTISIWIIAYPILLYFNKQYEKKSLIKKGE